jgi:four helix bundle protein
MAQNFEDLQVWQKAVELAVRIYALTRMFPDDERFGLTSQLRRSAVSVSSNIAEGRGRLSEGDFRQFLGIAQGSTYEVLTQLLIAKRLRFAPLEAIAECEDLSNEVSKMLSALIARLPRKARS